MALIEIDGLPNLKMVIFHCKLLNNQMVNEVSNGYFLCNLHDVMGNMDPFLSSVAYIIAMDANGYN